jgi:hypothetical protein
MKTQAYLMLNLAKGLTEQAIKRSEPAFIGDAIQRIADTYNIDQRILGFIQDATIAQTRMYDGQDASLPLASSIVWLEVAMKSEDRKA